MVRGTDVSVVDEAVTRAGREDVVVPGKGANPSGVACHGAETAGFLCVIYLHEAFVRADCDMRASLDPRNGGDKVIVVEFAELGYFARG